LYIYHFSLSSAYMDFSPVKDKNQPYCLTDYRK
jgi:hypothetical protein